MTAPFIEIKFQKWKQKISHQQALIYKTSESRIHKKSESRIHKFLKLSREGPTFVCIICNRCFYERSVQVVQSDKYALDVTEMAHPVVTSVGTTYVRKTRHLSLKKSEISAKCKFLLILKSQKI